MVNICKNKPAFLVSTKIVKEEDENTVKHANFMLSLVDISKFSKVNETHQFEGYFQHERTSFCDLRLLVIAEI